MVSDGTRIVRGISRSCGGGEYRKSDVVKLAGIVLELWRWRVCNTASVVLVTGLLREPWTRRAFDWSCGLL